MTYSNISFKDNKADYLLSLTAFFQSFLGLLQAVLTNIMGMPETTSSRVRVLSTALPILLSLIIVWRRSRNTLLNVYGLAGLIFLVTMLLWPDRYPYMIDDFTKFTLAVVIPTGLMVYSVHNLDVLMNSALIISIASMVLAVIYTVSILSGVFMLENYSMGFAFSLLLPTVIMLSREKLIWFVLAGIMTIMIFAIGSRGALATIIICAFVRIYAGKKSISKLLMYLIISILCYYLFFDALISFLANFLDGVGISSRTLRLLIQDEFFSHDSNRNELIMQAISLIHDSPIIGNGIWADRQYLGMYCHNIYYELLIDFGYIITYAIIIFFIIRFVKVYKVLSSINQRNLLLFTAAIIIPLMVSGSYLTNYNLALAIGLMGLYKRTSNTNTVNYEYTISD